MNIGDIKQGIRQRCRMDPRLTDNYMLNYCKQALARFAIKGKPFKKFEDIVTLAPGTRRYELPYYFVKADMVEYGTAQDFTVMEQIKLVEGRDFRITRNTQELVGYGVQRGNIELYFDPASDYTLRVHYTTRVDDILATLWTSDGALTDAVMPQEAILPMIEYVAFMHKKNYMKDQFTQDDRMDMENAEQDLYQIFNERVDYIGESATND